MTLRSVRRALLALLLLALLTVVWLGFRAYEVQRDLRASVDDATQLQSAVTAGDESTSAAALDRLRDDSGSAADKTSGFTWGLMTHLPVYGDDARGVQTVSDVVSDLARDGLPALTRSSGRIDRLTPRDGRIDLRTLESLQAPVAEGDVAFAAADRRLGDVDSDGFVGPLQDKYDDLAHRVDSVAGQLSAARTALKVMPTMLGADGAKNYLLVVQNNAEVRATGGLPGSVSVLHADNGKVTLTRQIAGNQLTAPPGRELPVTSEEQPIFSALLGTFFVDANVTPDFPRAAELMRDLWALKEPEPIAGVLTLDPVTLSYILGVVGPVTVGDVTVTADNAVDELLHNVYVRVSDPIKQDEFFQAVAKAVFDRVTAGAPSPEGLLRALSRGVSEHRVAVTDFDESVQRTLAPTAVAGALVTDPAAPPQVGFYVDDNTGAKMSYYLRYAAHVKATSCEDGRQQLTATATIESQAPKNAASLPDYITGGGVYGTPPGHQLDTVLVYSPVGGTISDLTLDGKPFEFRKLSQDGRAVAKVIIDSAPGQRTDLTWKMTTGPDQTGDPVLSVTPGVAPSNLSKTIPSACS